MWIFKGVRYKLLKSIAKSSVVIEIRFFHIRQACVTDIDFATQQAIKENRHIGPYDFRNAFEFDSRRFFVGEVDKKVLGSACGITYPNHHSYLGPCVVKEEYRGNRYGIRLFKTCYDSCDNRYTIGGDVRVADLRTEHLFKANGFQAFWNTYIAMLSIDKVVQNLREYKLPFQVSIKPSSMVSLASLLEYDTFVFGTPRHTFIKRWLTTPGSFGLVAVKDSKVVGYSVLRQVIRGGGTEIGLAMAPLFADCVHVAKALVKTAAEKCLANEAIPNTKLELFHPVGDDCGEGSSELMQELDAELTNFAVRMYSKGIPPRRKVERIYGIASPMFD